MIEMRRLKNVVVFIQTILSLVLSRKIIQNSFTILKWLSIQSQKMPLGSLLMHTATAMKNLIPKS